MRHIYLDIHSIDDPDNPYKFRQKPTAKFKKNCWLSPKGKAYFIEGAKHYLAEVHIAFSVMGWDGERLNHGEYFKDSFGKHLKAAGWLEIKDLSWCDDGERAIKIKPQIFGKKPNQKQINFLQDYCEAFKLDLREYIS